MRKNESDGGDKEMTRATMTEMVNVNSVDGDGGNNKPGKNEEGEELGGQRRRKGKIELELVKDGDNCDYGKQR
jgi:hypothetical protein